LCPHAMKLVHQQEAQAHQYATVSQSVSPSSVHLLLPCPLNINTSFRPIAG
jgi:hypothetical protein